MLTKFPADSTPVITAQAGDMPKLWAVVNYLLVDQTGGTPPADMMVTAIKLREVPLLIECERNSQWRQWVTPDRFIQAIIIAVGDKADCMKEANRIILSRKPRPICNEMGFSTYSIARPLLCSNGETYPTQSEACIRLGLSQSALSNHLAGRIRHVKGYTFAYKDNPKQSAPSPIPVPPGSVATPLVTLAVNGLTDWNKP